VLFRIKHFGVGYIYGRFNDVSGSFTLDDANPQQDAFDFEVKVESLDSNNKNRDKHLKSPDFFSGGEFATISFKSNSVKKLDDQNLEVTGDMTLHGVTRPMTVKIERVGVGSDPRGGQRAGLECVFNLNRTDFGMKNMLQGIGDEVRVIFAVEGVKK
jgi:polyisoprenoid-binding protein YceI